MQGFAVFDLIIISITLILGLKGLFRGLIKEVFGIIGIIGAIFVASRISKETGELLAPVLVLENEATIKLIGFVVALVGVWIIVYSAGIVVSKIFSASGLGVIDRFFGFIFGATKIFLIFSVIAYALYQVESFRKVINEKFATSAVMPHLISVGSHIIKLYTDSLANSFNKAIDTVKESPIVKDATSNIQENVNSTVNGAQEVIQEEIIKQVEEKIEESTNMSSEEIDAMKEKLKNIANKPEENQ